MELLLQTGVPAKHIRTFAAGEAVQINRALYGRVVEPLIIKAITY
jgi:hypothetical protein